MKSHNHFGSVVAAMIVSFSCFANAKDFEKIGICLGGIAWVVSDQSENKILTRYSKMVSGRYGEKAGNLYMNLDKCTRGDYSTKEPYDRCIGRLNKDDRALLEGYIKGFDFANRNTKPGNEPPNLNAICYSASQE